MLDNLWSAQNPEVTEVKVPFKDLEECHLLRKELLKQGEVSRVDEFWDKTLYSINSILWFWSNNPVPFSTEDDYILGHLEVLNAQLQLAKSFEYNSVPVLETLVEKVIKLRTLDTVPLFDLEELKLDIDKRICLIATSSSYHYLEQRAKQLSRKWVVKTVNELREELVYDEIVYFGQLGNLFSGKFADTTLEFIFTASRSKKILWIHYEWISSSWSPKINLIGSSDKTKPFKGSTNIFTSKGKYSINDIDLVPKIEEDRYLTLISQSVSEDAYERDSDTNQSEPAYCFLLTEKRNNKTLAAFISEESNRALAISDFDGDGILDIEKVSSKDLGKGMYILRRTKGADRDVIELIADRHLGDDAESLRSVQRRWKKELSKKVYEVGIEKAVQTLKTWGCTPANRSNLKRWMSRSSIRTSKPNHFFALMKFAGLETQAQVIWDDMRKINAAHSQAGFELDHLLKSKIQEIDAKTLYGQTSYEFTLSEDQNLGSMTAFAIEERLESTVEVPISWTYWGVREL